MIEIPFELPGAERARLVLEGINASFTVTQREVIKLASETEKGKAAMDALTEAFARDKVSADQMRAALAKVAEQAPRTAAEIQSAARAQEQAAERATRAADRARRESLQAFQDTARRRDEAARASSQTLGAAAQNFNAVVTAARTLYDVASSTADAVAALTTEQQQLTRVNQDLGVDLDAAASSTGRFVDETHVMAFASSAAARGLRFSQTELERLNHVAALFSQREGRNVGDVFNQIERGVLSGGQSLTKFDRSLMTVAGRSHSVEDRLKALLEVEARLPPATDDATTSLERYKDTIGDSARTAASAFVTEIARLQQIATGTRDAREATHDWDETLRAVGSTAAFVLQFVGRGIAFIVSSVVAAVTAIGNVGNAARQAVTGGARVAVQNVLNGDFEHLGAGVGTAAATGFANSMNDVAGGAFGTAREQLEALTALVNDRGRTSAEAPSFTLADARARREAEARNRATRASAGAGRSGHRRTARHHTSDTTDDAIRRAREEADRADRFVRGEGEEGANFLGFGDASRAHTQDRQAERERRRTQATQDKETEREKRARETELREQRDHSRQIEHFFRDQASAALDMGAVVGDAYQQMTGAASAHFEALVTGQETAGEALQGFVHDTLSAFAKIAAQQAVLELGKGFAALFLNPPEAAAHFTAAGLFTAAAAAFGGLAQATAPSTAAKGGGAGAANDHARAPRGRELRGENDNARATGATINVFFGGPMYGTGGVRRAAREIGGVLSAGAIQGGVAMNAAAVGF